MLYYTISNSFNQFSAVCHEDLEEIKLIKNILTSDDTSGENTKLNAAQPWSPSGNKPWVAVEFVSPVQLSSIKVQGDKNGNGVLAFAVKVQPKGAAKAEYIKEDDGSRKVRAFKK